MLNDLNVLRDFSGYLFLIIYYYANYYYFIPEYYFRKKYVQFVLSILICFAIITILPNILVPGIGNRKDDLSFATHLLMHINHTLFRFLLILFVSLFICINNRLVRTHREKLQAELSFLKAQINPHFLFNTLNSIYALAIKKSSDTPGALVKLSEMMRYVTTESEKSLVTLEKEINYIKNYVELQQIRIQHTAEVFFFFKGDTSGKKIAPLILIPFIENVFKYGVNPESNSVIRIDITVGENELLLHTFNNKVSISINDSSTGLGIDNTKQRLDFFYPGKHSLKIQNDSNDYSVNLKIQLI